MVLARSDKYIILCVQRNIYVFDTENKTHSITNVPQKIRKQKHGEENDEIKDHDIGCIVTSSVSKCNKLFAITTSGDKFAFIYKIQNGSLEILSTHQLARASSAINFTPDSKYLLVADKSGDCYMYDCALAPSKCETSEGKWILGHCSMVLDILMTKCLRFVITCDRDEKIRVTNFPQTEEIETYCLGHEEFISAILEITSIPNQTALVSISGDKTLRVWDYKNGREILQTILPAPGLHLVWNGKNHLGVVMLCERPLIGIYEILALDTSIQIKSCIEYELNENIKYVNSLIFKSDDCIWLTCLDQSNELNFKQLHFYDGKITETNLTDLKELIPLEKLCKLEDVTVLFKKKYDNINDYKEKKKRRLEDKKAIK